MFIYENRGIIIYIYSTWNGDWVTKGSRDFMCEIKDVCEFIIYHAHNAVNDLQIKNNRFTNLWLQKTLYYVFGNFYHAFHRQLFANDFEAWQYGPVVPEAYLLYQKYKKESIPQPIICPAFFDNEDERANLISTIKDCAAQPASVLVNKVHKETPWISASDNGSMTGIGVVIERSLMYDYFR